MSAPTAIIAESTSKRDREPSKSPSPPAKRPRPEDLTSEETPPSKNSFPPVEGVSQVCDGQKPPAATADTITAMSESTRYLIDYIQKGRAGLLSKEEVDYHWETVAPEDYKRYYHETGQTMPDILTSLFDPVPASAINSPGTQWYVDFLDQWEREHEAIDEDDEDDEETDSASKK